jgi:two-component system response regulator MprA
VPTILLVDDDEDLSEMLKDVLEIQGHSVTLELTGEGALNQLRAQNFELILLDWQLPDMSGLVVCKQYRTGGGQATILMLTGMRDQTSRDECLIAGANAVLTKPFSLDQLLPAVQGLMTASAERASDRGSPPRAPADL